MRQSEEAMTSVSAGHIILTPTQPVGSGRPQRESNSGPLHQESRGLPTELPFPPKEDKELTNNNSDPEVDMLLMLYMPSSLLDNPWINLAIFLNTVNTKKQ